MSARSKNMPDNRCRLVLMRHGAGLLSLSPEALTEMLAAGDVASLILSPDAGPDGGGALDEARFTTAVEPLVPVAQAAGVAVIIDRYSRVAGRSGADGLQLGQDADALRDAVDRLSPALMVGAGNVKSRHTALVLGEAQPDYLMFGRPGGDTREAANPKNLALGEWWSAMVEIPCIVQGGRSVDSVTVVAATGAEFVCLDAALDGEAAADGATIAPQPAAMAAVIHRANELLDAHAPRFDTEDS